MAVLKIYNQIVNEADKEILWWMTGTEGVCFKDIDEFVGSIPEDDNRIEMKLHCCGGSVTEGWAIVDKLRATGKEIEAVVEGDCASMASVILLAASKRKGMKHACVMIHDPYIPEYTLAGAYNAEDLQRIAENLSSERTKILDFYVERTGADRDVLDSMMKAETYMNMDKAKEMGFIHEIIEPISASGKRNWNYSSIIEKMDKSKQKTVAAALHQLGVALGVVKSVALELNTESGETLTIEKEEGEPVVGDSASPDGEHVMPDGSTIIVLDGIITEIKPAKEDDEDSTAKALEDANALIASLESQLAEANAKAKSSDEMKILNAVKTMGGLEKLKTIASSHKPQGRTNTGKDDEGKPVSKLEQRLAALKEKQ